MNSVEQRDSNAFFKLLAPTSKDQEAKFEQALKVIEETGIADEFKRLVDSLKSEKQELAVNQVVDFLAVLNGLYEKRKTYPEIDKLVQQFALTTTENPTSPALENLKKQ